MKARPRTRAKSTCTSCRARGTTCRAAATSCASARTTWRSARAEHCKRERTKPTDGIPWGDCSPHGMPSVGLFGYVGELLFFLGEAGEALAAQRLPQLDQATRLDLPDALAGDAVAARHFIKRPRLAVSQAKAKLDHFALA